MKFEVRTDSQAFRQAVTPRASLFIQDAVFALRAQFAALFGGGKTGRLYPRPRPVGGVYRASAPGEPPAIRSGALFRSLRESFPEALTGELRIGAPYAAFLEEGTPRMAPRPFIRPAVMAVRARFRSVREELL